MTADILAPKDHKKCGRCQEVKPVDCFGKNSSRADGLQAYCKDCQRSAGRQSFNKHKEKRHAANKAYRDKNAEREKERHRTYRAENLEYERERYRKYYADNIDFVRASKREWRQQHPEVARDWSARNEDKRREYVRKYKKNNPKKVLESARKYRKNNPEKVKKFNSAWQAANPHKVNENASRRRAVRLQATVSWTDKNAIDGFFAAAKMFTLYTGEEYHVDHIVPLRSKNVCGLHVEANLRVVQALENLKKSNRFWPDMW